MDHTGPTEISVSTTFFPAAVLPNVPGGGRSDLIVHTSDTVFFYVHRSVLLAKSHNNFGMLLSNPYYGPGSPSSSYDTHDNGETSTPHNPYAIPTVFVPQDSVVFNIILHLAYGMPCGRYGPSIEVIATTFEALAQYGIADPDPTNEIWTILLQQVQVDPLRVYAIGAAHAIERVCIQSSEHTLNIPLSNITEADSMMMGAIYLRRLFFLHFGRTDAFKRIVGPPPGTHPDTTACSGQSQRPIQKAWKAALADLLMKETPQATTTSAIISVFGPIANSTQCLACKERIQDRIATAVKGWDGVKKII